MKRKVIVALLMIILLVGFTGCKKGTGSNKSNLNKITLKDDAFGYTTNIYYPKDQTYTIKEETGGKFAEIVAENTEKNVSMNLYYFEMTENNYEVTKNSRNSSEGYRDYTWNKYKGYTYNGDKYSIDFNIILEKKDGTIVGLFGTVTAVNYKESDVTNYFNSEEFQNIMNSIEFSKK